MVGVGPVEVPRRLTEDRPVIGGDAGAFERAGREIPDEGDAPVRHTDGDQAEAVAVNPDGGRRRERVVPETHDRGADVANEDVNRGAVWREDGTEIAPAAGGRQDDDGDGRRDGQQAECDANPAEHAPLYRRPEAGKNPHNQACSR